MKAPLERPWPVVTYMARHGFSRSVLNEHDLLQYILSRYNVTLRVTTFQVRLWEGKGAGMCLYCWPSCTPGLAGWLAGCPLGELQYKRLGRKSRCCCCPLQEPLLEVVELLQRTDVLIGMHGAGETPPSYAPLACRLQLGAC